MPGPLTLEPPPSCDRLLEALRLRGIERRRRGGAGRHLMRRRGQSLEFREHLAYQPGMDVRHVDWRASFRHGKSDDLLVKTFVAEEDITLLFSIDPRPSMRLPEALPKLQIAAWLAWAVGRIGLRSGDRVLVHRLFGPARNSLREFRGTLAMDGLWSGIASLLAEPVTEDAPLNLEGIDRRLPPASAWLMLSDFYFPHDASTRPLATAMLRARDGNRWVIAGDLDSWRHEVAVMGAGARRIEGPGVAEEIECDVQDTSLREVQQSIEAHKRRFREAARLADRLHWNWPAEVRPDAAAWFKESLVRDPMLEQLFLHRGAAG